MRLSSGEGLTIPLQTSAVSAEPGGLSRARLLRGGMFFGFSQFAGMALGFLSSMALFRVADKTAVASYTLLQQAIMAVGMILQLGLGAAALRYVPVCRGRGGERAMAVLRRRLFGIQVALWVVVIPALALVWPVVARRLDAPELGRATVFLVAAALLTSFGHLADNYLRSFRLYVLSASLTHLVPRAFILGSFLFLLLLNPGRETWEVLASIYLGSSLVSALGYALALRATSAGEGSEPRQALPPPSVREILGTSSAMGLRSAAAVLFVSSSLWVLSWARPHEEVAVYAAAAALLQIMAAIPGISNFVIPQEFPALFADGRTADLEKLARTAATLVAILSLGCLAGILLFGRPLIRLAYGDAYAGAWGILLVLAVGSFWDSASGAAGYALQMTGHHVRLLLMTIAGAVLNIVLSLVLAPIWGGYGIAAATSMTLIVLNVAMVRAARSLLGVRTFVYTRPDQWKGALRIVGESGWSSWKGNRRP
ncbi:MAG TPA: polysaccharide biosynthesis C-terminal domain-containing protein [Thermoanaerobaculia bacterium]|nr:polysaccharide biosynthesis C-terminal domain-containing protein [Thermoanaerobaculia bacterium]